MLDRIQIQLNNRIRIRNPDGEHKKQGSPIKYFNNFFYNPCSYSAAVFLRATLSRCPSVRSQLTLQDITAITYSILLHLHTAYYSNYMQHITAITYSILQQLTLQHITAITYSI